MNSVGRGIRKVEFAQVAIGYLVVGHMGVIVPVQTYSVCTITVDCKSRGTLTFRAGINKHIVDVKISKTFINVWAHHKGQTSAVGGKLVERQSVSDGIPSTTMWQFVNAQHRVGVRMVALGRFVHIDQFDGVFHVLAPHTVTHRETAVAWVFETRQFGIGGVCARAVE